jgi:paired amphipathic helix protein Sin3a
MTPHAYQVGHGQPPPHIEPVYSPSIPGQMTAAEHLNNLNSNRNKTVQVEKQPPGEFNHAIQYLNKIKARYADDPNTYKQFLDILQTYHKEQKHSHDVGFFCFCFS